MSLLWRRSARRSLVRCIVLAVLYVALGVVITLTWQSIVNGLGTHFAELLAAGWVS